MALSRFGGVNEIPRSLRQRYLHRGIRMFNLSARTEQESGRFLPDLPAHCRGARASRMPRLLFVFAGAFLFRFAARQFSAARLQLPPRITRLEPFDRAPTLKIASFAETSNCKSRSRWRKRSKQSLVVGIHVHRLARSRASDLDHQAAAGSERDCGDSRSFALGRGVRRENPARAPLG
jgi:hypothetical protein